MDVMRRRQTHLSGAARKVATFVAEHPGCTYEDIDHGVEVERSPVFDGESEIDRARDLAAYAGLITSRREDDGLPRYYPHD